MEAWEEFLSEQEEKLGKETVKKWLTPLRITRFDARNLYLEANDSFQALWFEEHIRKAAQQFFVQRWNGKVKIHLQICNAPDKKKRAKPRKELQSPLPGPSPLSLTFEQLDPLCTFSSFVSTDDSLLACKLASEMTGYCFETRQSKENTPSWGTYNPLYVYGKHGSGKTHFLMALAHSAKSQGLHALYLRAETFTDHVVSAIRGGEMSRFRQTYRNADVLLIDDVDFFSGKGGTQEELFHTFNALHLSGKQIVLAASVAPHELVNIEPRLVSRFEWGIVLTLPLLENTERERLLQTKAEAMGVSLSSKVIEFLAETFWRGPQAAVRAMEALLLYKHRAEQKGEEYPLSLSAIKKVLAELIQEEQTLALTADQILQAVTEHFGIRRDDVVGKAQTKDCVLPRQLAMFLCRSLLKMPFMRIGELFVRDHSTVMASVQAIQKKIDDNQKEIVAAWRKICGQLQP